jgi:hypothetical protein
VLFLSLWIVALAGAAIHVSACRLWRHPARRVSIFLSYQLAISLGLTGFLVFVGHALRPTETAARIGWPVSPNFQFELGAVGLGIGVASLVTLVIRNRHYWLEVALAPSIFLVLAGANHAREAWRGNLEPYNVITIAPDLLIPLTLAWLLCRLFQLTPPNT